ncbi:redoxin domain-containing protein [Gemmata sp. G18]|uniref:thioredoxin-dependent peroxiredoxin n=1 Tax=Gemmata palustris TaxID=2822762 RepID=A0ABS5BL48_9BACT|nr:redoxin domain-containing protein [Gemmata palustris]MBP3954419.1 redoxin domain-containing protein [Gemmata palustris]
MPRFATSVALIAALALVTGCADRAHPTHGTGADPDVAREAAEYLRAKRVEPLSGPLQALLADPEKKSVPTAPHALLNQTAPTFVLTGSDDRPVDLGDVLARGPAVLVFYYGYSCDHCVAQLFGIEKDLPYFTEVGATVVAVSPDPPARTLKRYAEYGAFHFSVLSDPERAVASKYGVFRPAAGDLPKWQAHGTFVVGRDRRVRWASTGDEPFTDTTTLLRELAASEGRYAAAPPKGGTP